MALTHTPLAQPGTKCPEFDLPVVTGGRLRRADVQGPFLVMFICNHCPYVKAIEDRFVTLARDLEGLGVRTIAVCSNDAAHYPDDAPAELARRAGEKNYPFPYLHDESQTVARAFGAVCTPDFFLYDRTGTLTYRGRLDDSWKEPAKVTRRELFEAARAMVQTGNAPAFEAQTPSMGCSIKWRA